MRTYFLFCSRSVSRLNPQIRERINNILSNNFDIVVEMLMGLIKLSKNFYKNKIMLMCIFTFLAKFTEIMWGIGSLSSRQQKELRELFYAAKDKEI